MNERRRVAIHEAGHAVFMWRGGEVVHGANFNDRFAPFRSIVINDNPVDSEGFQPPMQVDGIGAHDAAGTVFAGYRLTVPDARRCKGGRRSKIVEHAKKEAEAMLVTLLAGPFVEVHARAADQGYRRDFDWRAELDSEADDFKGDVTKAFAIAETELCRGWRKAQACMDAAVARIAACIDSDRRYWSAVTTLADVLEERLALDSEEAIDAIRAGWAAGAAPNRDEADAPGPKSPT